MRVSAPGAFVHHVGGDGGQPFPLVGIGARAAVDLQDERDDRHAVVLDGAHAQPVRQRVPHDRRKAERRIGTNVRQPRPIDAHHDTDTGAEPGSASACWPRGTTLRSDAPIQREVRARRRPKRLRASRDAIPLEIGGEEAGIAVEHVVGVELIGLAAETARPSAAGR